MVQPVNALTVLALMMAELRPMSSVRQAEVVFASGAQRWVRPGTTHSATRDGLSYATAWGGFAEIVWAELGPNTTLWLSGQYDDVQLVVGATGSVGAPFDIRVNPADPCNIYNSRVMTAGEWTDSGVNGEWWIGGIVSPALMFYENNGRLRGPSTSSRNLMNVSAVDTAADTIAHSTERPFRLGDVVIISHEGSGAALPWITGGVQLQRHVAYYSIPVSANVTKLAATYADALAGTAIDIVADGDGSVWKVFHLNPDSHQDQLIGALEPGNYQWDGIAQRIYYRPTTGVPGDHLLRIAEERYSAIGSCIYLNGKTDVRIFGGGTYGGLFGEDSLLRVGLCHTNAVQADYCERIYVDGIEVSGCRSGVAFVAGAFHVLRNFKIRDCGWHAAGGESPVTPETDILVERGLIEDVGQKFDYQDAQAGVINTNSDRSVVRRVLCRRIGRDHAYVNNGVLVVDTSDDAHIYRCVVDDSYGEAFEMSLGANAGSMINSSISSCIVWRHNRTPNTRTGLYEMGRAGCFQFPQNDAVGDKTHRNFRVFGNLIAGCRFPVSSLVPNEVAAVVAARPLYATAVIEGLSFRRNAVIDLLQGEVYALNPRGVSVPTPELLADLNLFAGLPSGTAFYRLKRTGVTPDATYDIDHVLGGAGTWAGDTGNDAGSLLRAAVPVDVGAELPPAVLEFLRQDDAFDTMDAPTEELVGRFPFVDEGETTEYHQVDAAYSQEQYQQALAQLLPLGAAWPTDPDGVLMRFLSGLAAEMYRLDLRAAQLLGEALPTTSSELMADWERVLGLPDPCVTTTQTLAERRAAIQGRLSAVGGQSRAYFIDLAARLGYTVTIDEFTSALAATAAGITFTGDQWAHIWRVNVPTSVSEAPFRAGAGSAGEPLRTWGNEVIECQFNRYKPAHTQVLFAYAP